MNLLEQLKQLIATKEARKKELADKAEKSQDITEMRAINAELATTNNEIENLRSMVAAAEESATRNANPNALNPLGTYGIGQTQTRTEEVDPLDTLEYRKSFMKFAQTGVWEQRADALTTVTEAAKLIPTTIMKEIIKELKSRGQLFNRVRKLNVAGGVQFPILSLKPTATWITETTPSDRKKVTANTSVTFNYYGLECKVATSLIVSITALPQFEEQLGNIIVEAMVTALDLGIISGDGNGKPLGITVDPRVPAGNVISLAAADFVKWEGWKKKVFAKIPLAYRAEGILVMAASTWEGYIDGMVDTTGQPIARTNYNITERIIERFAGRDVQLVEPDTVADYDAAAVGDVVAVYFRPMDYGINSNMSMTMKRYFDEDKNEWVDKAIMVVDGKLLDANGVFIIKKAA